MCISGFFCFSACSDNREGVDRLNKMAYDYHYKSLDTVSLCAVRALGMSEHYDAGKAEALNNLAFVEIARMNYAHAGVLLDSVRDITDNQIELLVGDVQRMRLCQRESNNKAFYDYKENALRRLRRINKDYETLTQRQKDRVVYAQSEYHIVTSTYYYYVGLEKFTARELKNIDPNGSIRKDTAQWLNYLYQMGSGGALDFGTRQEIENKEFETLVECMALARKCGYKYWEANALQSLSEHLQGEVSRRAVTDRYFYLMPMVNTDEMPDSLLAGNLAQKALDMFRDYGDVYQTAGALRTLASCYWLLGDNSSALICLDDALGENPAIEKAPDLVASIREQLCLVYSAMDDKMNSDINRNIYLDLQEETRQDRFLEARAGQLDNVVWQLNLLIAAIVVMIVLVVALFVVFYYMRKRNSTNSSLVSLRKPIESWNTDAGAELERLKEQQEEKEGMLYVENSHVVTGKQRNMDNRARVFFVNSITPLIDRMLNEVRRIAAHDNEDSGGQDARYDYIVELASTINDYNGVLTQWIQLQQGKLSLKIESFDISDLFSIISKGKTAFSLRDVDLVVNAASCVVKADKVLTLFMINTLTDNALKFTPHGGRVTVGAEQTDRYVEIYVTDTGKGIAAGEMDGLFKRQIKNGHGFGLLNCKGIIDKYRKLSKVFDVCMLAAESKVGEGSRFFFRLPLGKALMWLALVLPGHCSLWAQTPGKQQKDANSLLLKADEYADSAYFSNIRGTYQKTVAFADSAIKCLNGYRKMKDGKGARRMMLYANNSIEPAELYWYRKGVQMDYGIVLDVRNECAIASLALHRWDLYNYNNNIYTQLFKLTSADASLPQYCKTMQRSGANKVIAISILVLLLVMIVVAFYFLYYRHVLYYKSCLEQVRHLNDTLSGDGSSDDKLDVADRLLSRRLPSDLRDVVADIRGTIVRRNAQMVEVKDRIDAIDDALRRKEYEKNRLHVCNSVLDNCLSALKHETMYYPSQICRLAESRKGSLTALDELVTYYKDLYSILSEQAMGQVSYNAFASKVCPLKNMTGIDVSVIGDEDMLGYMFDLLRRLNGGQAVVAELCERQGRYVSLRLTLGGMVRPDGESANAFVPSVGNIPFMICRQIIREISEKSNLRGCGMVVDYSDAGGCVVTLTLPWAATAGEAIIQKSDTLE